MRVKLGFAILGVLLLVPAVARGHNQPGRTGCQPTTLETLFPPTTTKTPDAPSVSVENGPSLKQRKRSLTQCAFVYSMVYPVAVESPRISSFGADRDGGTRKHKGTDIAAPKMTPVVAVADGEVHWIRDTMGGDCCAMGVRHDDGWRSYYIHLNNDTYRSDDGQGFGIAPGIELGSRVEAGQVIGFVGDSGNAETTPPHLHFELRTPGNVAIDAAPSLTAAARAMNIAAHNANGEVAVSQPPDGALAADLDVIGSEATKGKQGAASDIQGTSSIPLGTLRTPFRGAYTDDDLSRHATAIDLLASVGVLTGCETGLEFCPTRPATGETVTNWLERSLNITVDPARILTYGSSGIDLEQALMEQLTAGMTTEAIRGCSDRRYCSDEPLTRGEFAALVVGALDLGGSARDFFVDDDGHRFEPHIDLLVREGIFDTCAEPGSPEFLPDQPISRGEVATYISRVVGLTRSLSCAGID